MAARAGSTAKKSAKPKAARPKATRAEPHPETPLSLERILATAIEMLDEDGVDGLSMRKLADRLGSGVMSLYWHVASKEAVFDLALDAVLQYRAPTQAPQRKKWREDIVTMLEDWRAAMLRHPWAASLLPRRALGPSVLARLERLSQILSVAGVANKNLNVAIWSLWNHVMGATITRASFTPSDADKADAQQRMTQLGETYPAIERSGLLQDDDWDGAFRKGLDFLLDGLAPKQ